MAKTRLSASLRFKVTVGVLLPLVIVWSGLAYIRHINYQRRLIESVRTTAANTGQIIEGSLQHAMLTNDFSELDQVVASIGQQPSVRQLFLLDKAGQVLIATNDSMLGQTIDMGNDTCQACHQYTAATRNESMILTPPGEARVFRNVNAIENASSCIDCHDASDPVLGVLITDLDMSAIDQTLATDSRRTLWWSVGSGVLMAIVINLLMSRMVVRRVEQLVKAIRRVDDGDLEVEVSSHSSDELGHLASSFNQMVGGLREKEALERSLKERTKALQAQTERLSALNTIATTVSQSLDLRRILDSALAKIGELVDVRASWVVLRNEQAAGDDRYNHFAFAAGRGLPEGMTHDHVLCTWDRSACSEVFRLGESRVLQDPAGSGCPMTEYFRQAGLTARVCVPLQSKDRVLGVMSLVSNVPADSFDLSPDTLELLNGIGRQMGVAIENARLYEELRREEDLRRHLLERLIAVQEDERRRIALELHDQTGQLLTSLIMSLGAVGEAESLSQVHAYLPDLRETVAQVLREIHDLALELRPSVLDDLGLLPALRNLHKGFEDRFHLPVDFQVLGLDGERLPAKVETALYRIVQEALTNVARHAAAEHVSVLLERRRASVKLIVEDDGCGFHVTGADGASPRFAQAQDAPKRLGLYGMRERASLLGGTLTIESSSGTGTAIFVEIPLIDGKEHGGQDTSAGRG
jgi:signal transduction histidine kinase